jgi:hypothetical protein
MYFRANLYNIIPNLLVLVQFQRSNVPRWILYDTQQSLKNKIAPSKKIQKCSHVYTFMNPN